MQRVVPLGARDPRRIGAFDLLGRLGAGGQGVVYQGRAGDGTIVAVKVLHDGLVSGREDRGALAKELEVARRVAPFCTAQIVAADLDADPPYVASEYVDGPSLRETVRSDGPRTGNALHRLAVATATALVAIHEAGIVHRDLKPANVLIGPDGPRVIDFGIARIAEASTTVSDGVIGTPAYMAPSRPPGPGSGRRPTCSPGARSSRTPRSAARRSATARRRPWSPGSRTGSPTSATCPPPCATWCWPASPRTRRSGRPRTRSSCG
ncbi:protein kinase [Actinomadura sp. J1-007]|uniref:serine/threonine-protein kinase n=1 Tax=Actinomadura sp. J1-007 TaxID=2661913 RepID=UPI001325B9DB|nr:serine/threonine-protein kinase [Actinomadura sp. J1-007]MWK40618.1 protein kinase [Actinomadura sp. J1-007]